MVKDGQVIIVDEFTGRLMFGRRYSDGLHQAIEAKEGVKIERESQTLATITFQNYFRMYKKLAGMTGTAKTEEEEFRKIYGLDVVVIPTNKPMIREDHPDVVYKTEQAKFKAVVEKSRSATSGPAGAGGHGVHREVGAARRDAEARGIPAPGAERQVPRARGRDHRPGGQARARSPSPPTWPAAAPTSSWAATPSFWPGSEMRRAGYTAGADSLAADGR